MICTGGKNFSLLSTSYVGDRTFQRPSAVVKLKVNLVSICLSDGKSLLQKKLNLVLNENDMSYYLMGR